MARIRVLVVEDSVTVRRRLCEVLASDPEIEVIGEAGDGKIAIELCKELRPHVITMDMMMPVMTGLGATEYIMAHHPTPILIVSASTNRGELFRTYEAMAAGAVDVLEKPIGNEAEGVWEKKLLSVVKLVSRVRVITHIRARLRPTHTLGSASESRTKPQIRRTTYEVVAIGASTGGPGAIVEILRALPPEFTTPILFVLHISERFGSAFADWLDSQTDRVVRYAEEGDRVESARGQVLMARPDKHLIVQRGVLRLTNDPERHSCRPSVDSLFESVARTYGERAIGCLLTGMGRDGATGLLELRESGAYTIAQDEATSVVHGMPKEAIQLGAAESVAALDRIAPLLVSLCSVKKSEDHRV